MSLSIASYQQLYDCKPVPAYKMSRVAQLDSTALDQEIHNVFWADFQSNINTLKNKEEYKLLLDTLVFFCGSKFISRSKNTITYGSQLSGVSYRCRRSTLYLITIVSYYIEKKLSSLLFSSSPLETLNKQFFLKLYKWLTSIYSTWDLINFAQFLLSINSNNHTFLSPLHRALGVSSTTDTLNPINFYHNTVYAGIEFQNRQLLWNAILELFNATLLNNAKWFNRRPQKLTQAIEQNIDKVICPYCSEFPTNPYEISCCKAIYCYVCVAKSLEWSQCCNCNTTSELSAKPLY